MKLKNWFMADHNKKVIIYGTVYDDETGKFKDGAEIKTAAIKEVYEQDNKIFAKSSTNIYELCDSEYQNIKNINEDDKSRFEFTWRD